MTSEKMEVNSEICQIYTASPPETQNILEPIKLAPKEAKDNKVKIWTDLKPDIVNLDSTPVEYKIWANS